MPTWMVLIAGLVLNIFRDGEIRRSQVGLKMVFRVFDEIVFFFNIVRKFFMNRQVLLKVSLF